MKKLNKNGVAHHGLIALVFVLALVGAAGYLVWDRQSGITAYASNWTNLSGVGGISLDDDSRIMACKDYVSTNNGRSVIVKLQAYNESYVGNFSGSFEVKREGSKVGEVLLNARPYSVGRVQTTGFTIYPTDVWTGYISFRSGAVLSFAGPWSFDKIANC